MEQFGVPIPKEVNKFTFLIQGYKIPPVIFYRKRSIFFNIIEQLALKNTDSSPIMEYLTKIKTQKLKEQCQWNLWKNNNISKVSSFEY